MTDNPHEASPACVVSEDGAVEFNQAAHALVTQNNDLKLRHDALKLSCGQAQVAALFMRHPSLVSMTLRLSTSWEYDDSGGFHLIGSCLVENVRIDTFYEPPEAILNSGRPDTDLAALQFTDELDDEAPDLALALLGEDRSEDRVLTFQREELLRQLGLPSAQEGPATQAPPDQSAST